jgi:nifR3 family TIM-barrel protein
VTVGNIPLPNPVILAPMSGITDAPFRRLVARLGAGLVISEMTASAAFLKGNQQAVIRAQAAGQGIHVVQLAGCEAHWMAEAARLAQASGACIVDINMGCPARYVTGVQSGSALMRDLDHALLVIEAVVAAVSVPVTLKMRLGWDALSMNAADLAHRAQGAGVRLVTVHGRTRSQFYQDRANWDAVRAVRKRISIPLVVNGDISSPADAVAALEASGADAIMIGRAARGRPWLPAQVARYLAGGHREGAPALTKQFALIDELYEDLLAHHGREIGKRLARKHLGWSLDVAAQTVGCDPLLLKSHRRCVLTAEEPAMVRRHLATAYAALAKTERKAA